MSNLLSYVWNYDPNAGERTAKMNLEIEIRIIPRMVSGIETSFRSERRTSGWLMDTLSCVKRIGRKTFTLSEMYAFEGELAQKYPKQQAHTG